MKTPRNMTLEELVEEIHAHDRAAGNQPRVVNGTKPQLVGLVEQLRSAALAPAGYTAPAGGGPGMALELAPAVQLAVAPSIAAQELVERLAVIKTAMDEAMEPDVDYGVIPGTNKPCLFKPGAEKLGVLFQLDIEIVNEKTWHPTPVGALGGHLTVESIATVYHAPTGTRLGTGEGMCTSMEEKYAFRVGVLVCPVCGKPEVRKSKQEGKDEFYCWRKKGGCGEVFPNGTDAYAELAAVDPKPVPNPNLPDTYNTIVKMAAKRARVDAVLNVTGASALFTQDVEDQVQRSDGGAAEASDGRGRAATDDEVMEHIFAVVKAGFDGEIARQALITDSGGEPILAAVLIRHKRDLAGVVQRTKQAAEPSGDGAQQAADNERAEDAEWTPAPDTAYAPTPEEIAEAARIDFGGGEPAALDTENPAHG